jgi:hypothetical protein
MSKSVTESSGSRCSLVSQIRLESRQLYHIAP